GEPPGCRLVPRCRRRLRGRGSRAEKSPPIMDADRPLRPLAPNLWVADRPLKLVVGDIGARMTVVRLRDGGLVLHSPVRLDGETRRALDELGPVRAVI